MDIYILVSQRIGAIFDILPKDTISPRGNENTNVNTKISTEINIPLQSSLISVPTSIWFSSNVLYNIPPGYDLKRSTGPFIAYMVT